MLNLEKMHDEDMRVINLCALGIGSVSVTMMSLSFLYSMQFLIVSSFFLMMTIDNAWFDDNLCKTLCLSNSLISASTFST